MKDADKLAARDQQLVIKNLVEKGLLPDVAIGTGTVRNPGESTVTGMYEKGNRDNPRTFKERLAFEMSTDKSHVDRARDILSRKEKMGSYEHRQKASYAAETANASRYLDQLVKKAGPEAEARKGINKDDINKLLSDSSKLSAGEKRALEFMKENYDKLQTGGWRGADKITAESLARYSKDNFKTSDSTVATAKRAQIEKDVLSKSQETVKKGEGMWQVAERTAKERNPKATREEVSREWIKLMELNKGKKVLHPGDKVKTKSDEEIQREITRRLSDAA